MDRNIFINRELSWLEFNQRVLEEAKDESVPLLERVKFLSITSSNLDEFFMVRVGGLELLRARGSRKKEPSGMTPVQQLQQIAERVRLMVEDQYSCYLQSLDPKLREAGIVRVKPEELTTEQSEYISALFEDEILPVISPVAVVSTGHFPFITGLDLHLAVQLKKKDATDVSSFVIIPIERGLSRIVTIPAHKGFFYMLIEDVIKAYLYKLIPKAEILEAVCFRVTRNADMSVQEDAAADFMSEMQDLLTERKRSGCVRLEIESKVSRKLLLFMKDKLKVRECNIYKVPNTVNLAGLASIASTESFENLKYEGWPPQPVPEIDRQKKIFEQLANRDLLLCHPYDSFEPVLRFLKEAAVDPDVIAIKQTLYRTSPNSSIIEALKTAADQGKYVTVVVELKARFDESRNIEWAKNLEDAGVQVFYGVRGLKTHSKVCIVVRKESVGVVRYMHFGTGNYNEKTARLYSDISFMTNDSDYGRDASAFFNSVTGYSEPQQLLKIAAAPIGLREKLMELIESETMRCKQGQRAFIQAKMNSLADPGIIDALCRASTAGVQIRLNVRGICCLRPGVKGRSENISVVSIVDRFLEHSRIFYFYQDGDPKIFISSADWMPRNLDRRIELMVPVEGAKIKRKLTQILETYFKDNSKSWELKEDGSYSRKLASPNQKPIRSQQMFYEKAVEQALQSEKNKRKVFKPYHSKSKTI